MPTYTVLAALALLLPGVAYYAGRRTAEPFAREVSVASVVEELALVLQASLCAHFVAFLAWWGLGLVCPRVSPFELITGLITAADAVAIAHSASHVWTAPGDTLPRFAGGLLWIFGYLIVVAMVADAVGTHWRRWELRSTGTGPVSLREWAYDLVPKRSKRVTWITLWRESTVTGLRARQQDVEKARAKRPMIASYTQVFAATKLSNEQNHLMYRGRLRAISFLRGGRIDFVALEEPARSYLRLENEFPETVAFRKDIGSTHPGPAAGYRDLSLLVVNSDEVSNFVFERHTFRFNSDDLASLASKSPKFDQRRMEFLEDDKLVKELLDEDRRTSSASTEGGDAVNTESTQAK